jgi:hypothetical protein
MYFSQRTLSLRSLTATASREELQAVRTTFDRTVTLKLTTRGASELPGDYYSGITAGSGALLLVLALQALTHNIRTQSLMHEGMMEGED